MNIIILTEKDYFEENRYMIFDERFLHIKNILKSGVGDVIEIGLLNTAVGNAIVISISNSQVILELLQLDDIVRSTNRLDLICALPRPQTLKKVLNISATMGISNLYLIRSQKVEKSYFHSPLLEEENYTKFLIEGLSQGKRVDIPKVIIQNKFKPFFEIYLANKPMNTQCLLAHPGANTFLNKTTFNLTSNILLAIGPEGGWNEFEITMMQNFGFQKFRLSKNILRVESAVTAALAQIELVKNQ